MAVVGGDCAFWFRAAADGVLPAEATPAGMLMLTLMLALDCAW
jgi:hypothetical protein